MVNKMHIDDYDESDKYIYCRYNFRHEHLSEDLKRHDKPIVCGITIDGRCWNYYLERWVIPATSLHNRCSICFNGKTWAISLHKIVAELFVPNPHNHSQIYFIDGDSSNIVSDNLVWSNWGFTVLGNIYGRLHVTDIIHQHTTDIYVLCECSCGTKNHKVKVGHLKRGGTRSCGCLASDELIQRNTKHGLSKHLLYHRWCRMRRRCNDPTCDDYDDYGARGIRVCPEWDNLDNGIMNYFDWAVNNGWTPNCGLSIDRINNNGDYTPDNCRLATGIEQANNRRPRRKDMHSFNEHAIYIITHCDSDGYAAATAIKHKYPNAIILVTNYGKPFPRAKVPQGSTLFITDFSYKAKIMKQLAELYHVIWIDHHASAIKEMTQHDVSSSQITKVVDDSKAACIIAWEYCFPGEQVPLSFTYIGDYDTWKFKHPETLPFHYGLNLLDLFPSDRNQPTWEKIIHAEPTFMEDVVDKGKVIHEYVTLRDEAVVADICFDVTLGIQVKKDPEDPDSIIVAGRFNCLVANVRGINSLFFDSVPDLDKYDALISYGYIPTINQYRYSIYQNKPSVHVGNIAAAYGGGGHAGAAGFTLKKPLILPEPVPEGTTEVFEYVDHLADVATRIQASNLVRMFNNKNERIGIRSQLYTETFLDQQAVLCNSPYTWPDIWFNVDTGNATLGIAYTMTKNGWYRIVITNLGTVDMDKIAEKVKGKVMPNGSVWFYQPAGDWPEFVPF